MNDVQLEEWRRYVCNRLLGYKHQVRGEFIFRTVCDRCEAENILVNGLAEPHQV